MTKTSSAKSATGQSVSQKGFMGRRFATLERNKDLQCPTCCGPGVFKCDSITRDGYTPAMISEMLQHHPELAPKAHFFMHGWKGCYVQMNDPRLNQPVGEKCPNCGGRRPARKKLNKILLKGALF